ncbi:hypothetical protein [Moraxella bovis]|uniref:hypothetical protein n=1 Tax=Moraxella bovis TaxID=476 RepID=UPI0022268B6F|nr:hypothetical protein [Moraxella bovis]UZA28384.1 hypothetical protein LP119_05365 [Moraxella bovis]
MNRLNRIKSLPCVQCHAPPPSDPCHANWAEMGKGMGKRQMMSTRYHCAENAIKSWTLIKDETVNGLRRGF